MSFNFEECAIPTVWCGDGRRPKRKKDSETVYYRTGSRYECMKKGFGAGMYTEKKKNLPASSIQQIKYVGEVYEKRFRLKGIKNLRGLHKHLQNSSSFQTQSLLQGVFTKKGGTLDRRAYNSTLMYLYRHGIGNLPRCLVIKS